MFNRLLTRIAITATIALATIVGIAAPHAGAIDGGRDITPESFREVWEPMVRLEIDRQDGSTRGCGGVVSGARTIITAGHCVFDWKVTETAGGGRAVAFNPVVEVRAYTHMLLTRPGANARPLEVVRMSVDGDYHGTSDDYDQGHDIAVLETATDIPVASALFAEAPSGGTAIVAGYGLDSAGNRPTQAQEGPMHLHPGCQGHGVDADEFCMTAIGGVNVRACFGDSGSPVMIHDAATSRYYAIGVLSRGDCSAPVGNTLSIATRINVQPAHWYTRNVADVPRDNSDLFSDSEVSDPAPQPAPGLTGANSELPNYGNDANTPADFGTGTGLPNYDNGANTPADFGTGTGLPNYEPVAEPNRPLTATTGYTASELADLQRAADYLGLRPAEFQALGVHVLKFISQISNASAPVNFQAPAVDGAHTFTSEWTGSAAEALTWTQDYLGVNAAEAQKTGAVLLTFLVGVEMAASA